MEDKYKLIRFLEAQNQMYLTALSEIKKGQKRSHWMWFIFPQLKGLGQSDTALYYGIQDLGEAKAYLQHRVLGKHLVEISTELLNIEGKSATAIFGSPDDLKLHSSMTLFAAAESSEPVFENVLAKYFKRQADATTISILENRQ
jgi:uncharacterized protein (DUF1810 family)